jgi:hypothetical protein
VNQSGLPTFSHVMTPAPSGPGDGRASAGEGQQLPAGAIQVNPGDRVPVRLPASEVMMHMRLAGRVMLVELTAGGGAQVRNPDGSPVSFPVLPSEAGLFTRHDGTLYAYPEPVPSHIHQTPAAMARARAAASGAARRSRPR